jgi:hypothetical protein
MKHVHVMGIMDSYSLSSSASGKLQWLCERLQVVGGLLLVILSQFAKLFFRWEVLERNIITHG